LIPKKTKKNTKPLHYALSCDVTGRAAREQEYSATVATMLLENDEFQDICAFMKRFELWNAEIQDLYATMEKNSLGSTPSPASN
jgi:hypothetical protein